jgi:hypothetical protein
MKAQYNAVILFFDKNEFFMLKRFTERMIRRLYL